jgi:tetratricopeptide (TPR) repeat protein
MIQNHPEAAVLGNPEGQLVPGLQNYTKGESLWEEQLIKNPNNIKILRNAGKYIMHSDLDLAISYFKKGKDLDPDNAASWDRELAQFYKLKMIRSSAAESQSLANESLKSFESAYAGSSQLERGFLVPNLAKAALTTGQLEKAAEYAHQMLTTTATFNKGDFVYNGNFVLGMIAVKKGDIESAEKYLLEAGETSGSPVLKSFGPNMSLAKELLDRGKKDTVLAFLKKCAKFWNKPPSPCNQWIQELEEGQTPDFGRNLIY